MPESGWKPKVYTCSAVEGNGLPEIWNGIEDFLKFTKQNGYYQQNRNRQSKYWMYESINEALRESFYRAAGTCQPEKFLCCRQGALDPLFRFDQTIIFNRCVMKY